MTQLKKQVSPVGYNFRSADGKSIILLSAILKNNFTQVCEVIDYANPDEKKLMFNSIFTQTNTEQKKYIYAPYMEALIKNNKKIINKLLECAESIDIKEEMLASITKPNKSLLHIKKLFAYDDDLDIPNQITTEEKCIYPELQGILLGDGAPSFDL